MASIRIPRWRLGTATAMLWLGLAIPTLHAAGLSTEEVARLREDAAREKAAGNWAKAVWYYGGLHNCDRSNPTFKRELQICLRHLLRGQRHADPAYSEEVLRLDSKIALDVYMEILTTLRDRYLLPELTSPESLYQNGLEELKLALSDPEFRRKQLSRNKNTQKSVDLFLRAVEKIEAPKFSNPLETIRRRVQEVAMTAEWALDLNPTVTIFEFVCGACNALDEHTYYLSPKHFAGDNGDAGDIGIEVSMNKLKQPVVTAVYENSPAAKAGIKVGDVITRVDKDRDLSRMSREMVADRFKGELGTKIQLELTTPGDESPREVSVVRQPVALRSVTTQMLDPIAGVGYLQVYNFQQTTDADIRGAVQELHDLGAKSIIVDLRGNPGGSFEEAVKSAEQFLPYNSPIVSLKGREGEKRGAPLRSANRDHVRTPLCVLVDRETASAAELLAGALKENDRALLAGQRTFGKGTMQEVERLLKDRKVLDKNKRLHAGGLRFTRAHFLSPLNNLYQNQGVVPHKEIENPPSRNFDEQLEAALRESREAAQNFNMMTMMMR